MQSRPKGFALDQVRRRAAAGREFVLLAVFLAGCLCAAGVLLCLPAKPANAAAAQAPDARTLLEKAGTRGSALPAAQVDKLRRSIAATMRTMHVPGVLFAVHIPGKRDVVIRKGVSDLAKGSRISTRNVFRIGSISKTFTSTVMLQLADEGKLSLDDPLSKYQPAFPNASGITLRMLLNHRSGIYSYTDDPGFQTMITTRPLRPWTPDELIGIGRSHVPYFSPDSAFDYSNTAYILAGKVIEQVTGNTWEHEVDTRIIRPLRLRHTLLPNGTRIPGRYARGYTYDLGGGLKDITRQQTPTWGWSAGGLVSDLRDLQVCAKVFGTGSLLSPAMRAEYFAKTPMPTKPGTPPSAFSGLGIGMVDGWVGNTGGTYGYTTWMWYVPDHRATVVVFFNETSTFTPAYEVREQTALQGLLQTAFDVL